MITVRRQGVSKARRQQKLAQPRKAGRTDGLADGGQQHVCAGGDALLRQCKRQRAAGHVQKTRALVLLIVVRAAGGAEHAAAVRDGDLGEEKAAQPAVA